MQRLFTQKRKGMLTDPVFCDTILDGKFKTETRKMNHEYLYYLQKPF